MESPCAEPQAVRREEDDAAESSQESKYSPPCWQEDVFHAPGGTFHGEHAYDQRGDDDWNGKDTVSCCSAGLSEEKRYFVFDFLIVPPLLQDD